ncbi:MAG: gephyrin-like molybdotransferase Glp [Gemmatimonadota bacterium]
MTDFETLEADWLSVGEAIEGTLSHARPLPSESVELEAAPGRVLARTLEARVTLPPWDNSAMDGYAVRAVDVAGATPKDAVELPVAGVVQAGDEAPARLPEGAALRIMTGAPVPKGADSIVRVEDTDGEREVEGRIRIYSDRDAGRHIRPAGRDAREGDTVVTGGTTIASGQIAVLASQGYARVPVYGRPRVALLPNGDELATIEEFDEVAAGRAVPESNGPTLAAAARGAGAEARILPIARDEPRSILERLDEAVSADVLVTMGGASMGEADLLKRVMFERGYQLDFWRVRIRPGSPFSLGFLPRESASETAPSGRADVRGRRAPGLLPVFGLPGNPGSAYVTFQLFVRPFLLALAGHRRIHRPVVRARMAEALESPGHLTHFFRVRLSEGAGGDDGWTAHLTGPQGSGLVQSLARADGLAVVPEDTVRVEEGEEVRVILLGEGPGWREDPGY